MRSGPGKRGNRTSGLIVRLPDKPGTGRNRVKFIWMGDLITEAAKGARENILALQSVGEGVHTLLAAGNLEATIMLECMWDEIAQHYEVDVLRGYFRSAFANEESILTLERVCAEHTAAHGRELCY